MKEMISRDTVLKILNHNWGKPKGYSQSINEISELPTIEERKTGWIPCSERLPEDDTEVFVYLFDHPSCYIAWVCDGCWFTEEFQVEKENYPKAWMPLPAPYQGEGEGE